MYVVGPLRETSDHLWSHPTESPHGFCKYTLPEWICTHAFIHVFIFSSILFPSIGYIYIYIHIIYIYIYIKDYKNLWIIFPPTTELYFFPNETSRLASVEHQPSRRHGRQETSGPHFCQLHAASSETGTMLWQRAKKFARWWHLLFP